MAKAERVGDLIHLYSEFREKDLVKQVPGVRYDRQADVWYAPLSWGTCVTLRGVFKERLEIGPSLEEWAWEEYNNRILPTEQLRQLRRVALPALPGEQLFTWDALFPHQTVDVAFGSIAERYLNGSEMGAGKTVIAIATLARWQMRNKDALPALIIGTNTMKRTWVREFKVWAPWLRVERLHGSSTARRKTIQRVVDEEVDVLVTNWESLRSHSRLAPYGSIHLKRCAACGGDSNVKPTACEVHPKELNQIAWKAIIADEAHRMKSPQALQTRAAWALGHGLGRPVGEAPRYKIALTGTPIADTPDDLWSLLHWLAPEDWPAKTKFIERFCAMAYNPFGGMDIVGLRAETKDEFYKVFDSRFIRHIISEVLPDIPPLLPPQIRFVEMGAAQAKAYKKMQKDMVAQVDGGTIVETNPLTLAIRLSQFACAYAELGQDGNPVLAEPSNKIDALLELVEERNGRPLVAMAESRQLIELAEARLKKAGIPFVSIHGGIPEEERDEAQQRFQTGRIPVFLGTLGAGSEGLTLTAADTFVYLQRSWSHLKNKQAEGRVRRPGSEIHEHIQIIDLVTEGTIEEKRLQQLGGKADRLEQIVRDRQAMWKMLGVEDGDEEKERSAGDDAKPKKKRSRKSKDDGEMS